MEERRRSSGLEDARSIAATEPPSSWKCRSLAGRSVVVVGVVEDDRLPAEHEQVAAVRPRQHVRVEDQRRRAVGDDPSGSPCATCWKRCAAQARSWVVATTVLPLRRLGLEEVHAGPPGSWRRRR